MTPRTLQKTVWKYYKTHGRDLPWRSARTTPYEILVSEIMLQQTQVDRVIPKYKAFIRTFPNFKRLAKTPQRDVLKQWSGLGYNRRALNLHRAAQIVMEKYHGRLPKEREQLLALPGIGPYTAGAIRAFAYNISDVLIETNIRTVYLHHYFQNKRAVRDRDIEQVVIQTLARENPREWYWALMDYGAHLKKTVGNKNTRSAHYTKQSRFEGSNRQLRGTILRALTEKPTAITELAKRLGVQNKKAAAIAAELAKEGFIKQQGKLLLLA